jgi:hypothetical protein
MARPESNTSPAQGGTGKGANPGRSPAGCSRWLLVTLLLGLGFYGGWSARALPWFSAAKPKPTPAPSERQRLLASGWREAESGVFVRTCTENCRRPRLYGGGAVEVLEVECLDRPCGQIRANFKVMGADGAALENVSVSANGRQGERLQLVAETHNPQARSLVLQAFSSRARVD